MDSSEILAYNPPGLPNRTFVIAFVLDQIMSSLSSLLAEGALLQGRYRIKHLIGKGGMGAVYETKDERLGHSVALKQNFFGADEQMKHAFEREARLLANLEHPSLPRVTDYFTEDCGQFLVMEFITGKDLLALLKERASSFPVEQVLAWADQLLDALEYLHTQQPPIIHRDVKPQNLKVTPKGEIMLLDFGLAKGTTSGLTSIMAGSSIVGYTPGYASLEQVTGKGTDERSDLYSLAATLYHLLTNQTPPDAMVRLGETTNDDPDPLRPAEELNALVPPALSGLLRKAMAQKRNDRPASATTMRQALKECGVDDELTRVRQAEPRAPAPPSQDDAPTPRPRPVVIDLPPPIPPIKHEVRPQSQSKKLIVRPWALLVAALYSLAIITLTCPELIVAFWPLRGGWRESGLVFLFWPYWVFVAVMVLSQVALLKVPVGLANRRPVTRRSLLLPVVVTGLMICLLVICAILALIELFFQNKSPRTGEFLTLTVGGLTWVLWTVIFYRLSRNENPGDVISRQCRYLLKGSILELLIAVPTHIVARSRDYCCAGLMTFVGITLGIAVMLMSFGPGVFFLFLDRWKRLHKYREPADGSPSG